jgi:hypothetical protein
VVVIFADSGRNYLTKVFGQEVVEKEISSTQYSEADV